MDYERPDIDSRDAVQDTVLGQPLSLVKLDLTPVWRRSSQAGEGE
jgi:hypothetical protein